MPLLETLLVTLGPALAKGLLKVYFKDQPIVDEAGGGIATWLVGIFQDTSAAHRSERQFLHIGQRVARELEPIFREYRLDEGEQNSVAIEVADTLESSKLDARLLAQRNFNDQALAKYLLENARPRETRGFSSAGDALFERIVRMSSRYIVDIASTLPHFQEGTLAEVLNREDELLAQIDKVLDEVSSALAAEERRRSAKARAVEEAYRAAAALAVQGLEWFGLSRPGPNRPPKVATAFLPLTVAPPAWSRPAETPRQTGTRGRPAADQLTVDKALATHRLCFIRGEAGSGKSTLLRWLALRSVTNTFEGELAAWNDTVPFLVTLQKFVGLPLPLVESFPEQLTRTMSRDEAASWASTQLTSGRAVVLVDGVDDLPAHERDKARSWLEELALLNPTTRIVVTSRGYAVAEDWVPEGFEVLDLQPMRLSDMLAFVDRWHDTAKQLPGANSAELTELGAQLKLRLEATPELRNLAATPLLCSIVCGLHQQHRAKLPASRMELYEVCCRELLNRHQHEPSALQPTRTSLTNEDTRGLLEVLAYWMVRNAAPQIDTAQADRVLQRALGSLSGLPPGVTGTTARLYILERSGMLREPSQGKLSFTHRTFQDFLAAKAAVDQEDVGVLLEHALSDQWHDVVVLAAGHAQGQTRVAFVDGLVERGSRNEQQARQFNLLAVACLETAPELPKSTYGAIADRLGELAPPRSLDEARTLASAGDVVVPMLASVAGQSAQTAAACVRCLALIGSEAALDAVETYAADGRSVVLSELLRAWDAFDHDVYAQRVIRPAIAKSHSLSLGRVSTLRGMQHLEGLRTLSISEVRTNDLSPLTTYPVTTSSRRGRR